LIKKIYAALWGESAYPFGVLANGNVQVVRDPEELKEKDAMLVVWGGSDINPAYYNHPMHSTTHPGGQRDKVEWGLMQRAIEMGMSIAGVCRGGQMLCAAAGGWLIQDVSGHVHAGHDVVTHDGKRFGVNTIHHQMMAGLENTAHELVAWSPSRRSTRYGYRDNQEWTPPEDWVEPEFVYFSKINGYAIQWHPEGLRENSDANKYVLNFIKTKEAERDERSRNQSKLPVCGC
jgi:gamma-glutamyl-gamma-aminobutyrate hydrolase PuuD